ncbi:MAG: preprotein translocase subunit SecA [Candidatus Promineifilaceae bacterium]|nr:preprotein translocase subunit SecA [Candidatus Promineifilaceae bacterium]
MLKKLFHFVVGDPHEKMLDSLKLVVEEVGELESHYEDFSDEELREETTRLRERLQGGESLGDLLVEAYALVREASKRTTGLRHYDVQIMGGILLHRGEVIEMRTGEGKTLVATLPLFLNALTGEGAHLVTVNEYLARRDGGWMGKIFHFLGLSVACIGPQKFSALYDPDYVNPGAELEDERLVHWRPCTRGEAYLADITYGTSSEFGFDYLRDNMVSDPADLVQRDPHYAVIDEVDNVLIDEARTPLIISGPVNRSGREYQRFAKYVRNLKPNTAEDEEPPNGHYDIDEKSRSITLTELGIAEIENRIDEIDVEAGDSLYDPRYYHLTYYLDNALRAEYMFHRDKQYVVQDGQVVIVDDFTGRLMAGRRYSDGLHEAIEAKEGVTIKRETVTVATITLQNYFRLYDKLAGMTGTAVTDAEEFGEIYNLDVSPLPTNVEYIVENGEMGLVEHRQKEDGTEAIYYAPAEEPSQPVFFKRTDYPDQVYRDEEAKDLAIISEIKKVHTAGRPILVGTTSVEHSEMIHNLLNREKIKHEVLNAKHHGREALIVAQAGRRSAVTISTNMAGRGTDILLGGNPEGMAAEALEEEMFDHNDLIALAQKLLEEGEEAARELASRHGKLTEDLVESLVETRAEYDEALEEIGEVQIIGYLARSLQEPYDIDYNQLLKVLPLVRLNRLQEARDYLESIDMDVAVADEAARLMLLYSRYERAQTDTRRQAEFLAELVFEHNYNGRAALIRSVLADDLDEAQELVETVPGLERKWLERILEVREQARRERQEVWELGGLHVVGSERHESRRIDNQLRGRAARQGDPGSSRFFLSLEDDLMRRFGGERLRRFMSGNVLPDDVPLEMGILDRIIESAQERIEGYNFDIRKNVVEYDDVMNKQRQAIYDERRGILMGEEVDLDERVRDAFETHIREIVHNYLVDYPGFIRGEVERAITDHSTDATDTLNVNGVLNRMRGFLPGLLTADRSELLELSDRQLTERLMRLAHENVSEGRNLYQLLQAMNRFVPLLPPVPNLGARLGAMRANQLQQRESLRRDYVQQVESLFNSFLASQIEPEEREEIWQRAVEGIDEAFSDFAVEGLSLQAMKNQQARFKREMEDVLQTLLIDSLSALEAEQLVEALQGHVEEQQRRWRQRIGEEEYRNFQRLLLLGAIDREWRDYLTAMDDLRREIGLEAVGQRDPKVEYKRRSYQMFADMRTNISENVVDRFFRELARHQEFIRRQEEQAQQQQQLSQAGYQVVQRESGKGVELRRDMPEVGRNDPCPCGSGRKYKKCHGDPKRQRAAAGNGRGKRVRARR